MGEHLDMVRAYYEALNRGDIEAVTSFFCDDAVHYYTTLRPTHGARPIADLAVLAHEAFSGQYFIEDAVDDGEQVCVEWTMAWRDPGSGKERLNRGAEFYRFRDGKIFEVRSYSGSTGDNRSGDLVDFDHAGRGYVVLAKSRN